ncbi:MAG: response regulator [Lewinellaceae bacterium]|nr:response regulator [Lewinellaceae bacterium]
MQRMFKHCSWILACLLLSLFCSAQEGPVREALTADIYSNFGAVKSLYQAPDGLIWIGAYPKGLAYYDGKKITHVPVGREEIFANRREVFIAGDTVLYLNMGQRVAVFSLSLQKITAELTLPKGLSTQERILNLSWSNSAEGPLLWASVQPPRETNPPKYSVCRLLLSKNGGPFQFVSDNKITTAGACAFVAYNNHLMVKGKSQFLELDQRGKTVRVIPLPAIDLSHTTNQYLKYVDSVLWFLSFDTVPGISIIGLKILPDSTPIVFKYLLGKTTGMNRIEVRKNTLFICSYFLRVVDIPTKTILFDQGVGWLPVHSAFTDRQGVTWYGDDHGLKKVRFPPVAFKKYPYLRVRGMAEDERGTIYVANGYQSIGHLNPVSDSIFPEFVVPNPVYYINYHNGQLYSGHFRINVETDWGLERLLPAVLGPGDNNVQVIDSKEQLLTIPWKGWDLWIADLNDTSKARAVRISALTEIDFIEMDALYQRPSDSTVWLGTHGSGIFVFSKNGGKLLEHYTSNTNSKIRLPNNVVTSFFEDENQNLWFGHAAGLSRLKPGGTTVENFEIDPDEPMYNLVYGILPEENQDGSIDFLWLSTNRGLYRFEIQSGVTMGFPLNHELMQAEFNRASYFKAKNGRLYFGTNSQGLYAFYPKEVMAIYDRLKGENLPIVITHFSKFDSDLKTDVSPISALQTIREIRLKHGERYFDLEFSVADYRIPGANYYTYLLEGYDVDWKKISRNNNRVHYENLPPGTYTLRLRGGLFKSSLPFNERSIRVRILPAWYETWWAYTLYASLLFGSVYFIYRFNLRRQLEKQEAIRLVELDSLKTRLYTNITHEFRTPLTVIMGMTDNIRGHESERNLITRNSKNLLRLINQLLDLSKLDSGSMQMDMVQGDVINYLRYLLESFHSMAQEKGIRLEFESTIPELIMDYDEVKLQHIVYNLLSNAIKFTAPNTDGKITLQVNQTTENGQAMLGLSVQDTGMGIPVEHLPHIFDRFFQVDSSTTRKGTGSGIGLTLAKELTEMMGGTIVVKSTVGVGSTFIIQLPVRREATTASQPQPVAVSRPPKPEKPRHITTPTPAEVEAGVDDNPQLLIIEDNPDIIAYLRSILGKDYAIETAPDGQAGIDKALEQVPDIIITDVMMPEKDGYEVCATLKTDERTSHIPIIMLTAKATEADRVTGLKTGADAYLMKPFNKEELLVRLEKLIELRRALQQRYARAAGPLGILGLPEDKKPGSVPTLDDLFLEKIRQVIDEKIDQPELGIADLCATVHLGHTQVFRKLKALTGEHPTGFIRKVRLHKAKVLLQTTELNISEIAYDLGFTDPAYFSRAFSQEFGVPPSGVRG